MSHFFPYFIYSVLTFVIIVFRFDATDAGFEWYVSSVSLRLQPPRVSSSSIQLWTTSLKKQPFEVNVQNHPPGFTLIVTPSVGIIPIGDTINLMITCFPKGTQIPKHHNTWRGTIKVRMM